MARNERFIVKVQLPLSANTPDAPALMYDETRGIEAMMPVDVELLEKMGNTAKRFFWARFIPHDEAVDPDVGIVVLDEQAPWQDW